MELIPKDIRKQIPNLYETEEQKEKMCYVKLFLPSSDWTWYIIELDKHDENTCYGLVDGFEKELGYFSLKELANIRDALGVKVERDISFKPTKLETILKGDY